MQACCCRIRSSRFLPLGLNQSLVLLRAPRAGEQGAGISPVPPAHQQAWERSPLPLLLGWDLRSVRLSPTELRELMPSRRCLHCFRLAGSSFDLALMGSGRIKASALVPHRLGSVLLALLIAGPSDALGGRRLRRRDGRTFAKAVRVWIVLRQPRAAHLAARPAPPARLHPPVSALAFALFIPQQPFHSYLSSATESRAERRRRSKRRLLPVPSWTCSTTRSEILAARPSPRHDAKGDNAGALRLFPARPVAQALVRVRAGHGAPRRRRTRGDPLLSTDRYLGARYRFFRLGLVSRSDGRAAPRRADARRAQNRFMCGSASASWR